MHSPQPAARKCYRIATARHSIRLQDAVLDGWKSHAPISINLFDVGASWLRDFAGAPSGSFSSSRILGGARTMKPPKGTAHTMAFKQSVSPPLFEGHGMRCSLPWLHS